MTSVFLRQEEGERIARGTDQVRARACLCVRACARARVCLGEAETEGQGRDGARSVQLRRSWDRSFHPRVRAEMRRSSVSDTAKIT